MYCAENVGELNLMGTNKRINMIFNQQYLLQMNVLVDNSLVPLWVQGLLSVPGPPLVISAAGCNIQSSC